MKQYMLQYINIGFIQTYMIKLILKKKSGLYSMKSPALQVDRTGCMFVSVENGGFQSVLLRLY